MLSVPFCSLQKQQWCVYQVSGQWKPAVYKHWDGLSYDLLEQALFNVGLWNFTRDYCWLDKFHHVSSNGPVTACQIRWYFSSTEKGKRFKSPIVQNPRVLHCSKCLVQTTRSLHTVMHTMAYIFQFDHTVRVMLLRHFFPKCRKFWPKFSRVQAHKGQCTFGQNWSNGKQYKVVRVYGGTWAM